MIHTGWHRKSALAGSLLLGLALTSGQALADEPGLASLIPLMTLYKTGNPDQPKGDVAWVRCAALYEAQRVWAVGHPAVAAPSPAQQADIDMLLARTERLRTTDYKAGEPAPQLSTSDDAYRVRDLYTAHFTQNADAGRPAWVGDKLMKFDMIYCDAVGGRR